MNIDDKIKHFYKIIEEAVVKNFNKKEMNGDNKRKIPQKIKILFNNEHMFIYLIN